MKKLKIVCAIMLVASAIVCAVALWSNKSPVTFEDSLKAKYGDDYQQVYSTVQTEIANYIIQYGFLTDSWVIQTSPTFSDEDMTVKAELKDGTVLDVTYYNDTGECYVEVDTSINDNTNTGM